MSTTRRSRAKSKARRAPAAPPGRDLLDYRLVRAVLTHPLYPGVLRWSMAAVFALVGYQLWPGPPRSTTTWAAR